MIEDEPAPRAKPIVPESVMYTNSQAAREIEAIMLARFRPTKACAKEMIPVAKEIAEFAARHYLQLYNLIHQEVDGRA
ncbi:hypothetical protein [Methylobacterium symbioticum]|nr:hypothetical protein [Methylobacterium symbioticum]